MTRSVYLYESKDFFFSTSSVPQNLETYILQQFWDARLEVNWFLKLRYKPKGNSEPLFKENETIKEYKSNVLVYKEFMFKYRYMKIEFKISYKSSVKITIYGTIYILQK